MLRVTGAAYVIQLIRDFCRLTLELATVVVVVVWYVPRPRVQALVLLGKTGECHKLIRLVKEWWPDN